jgi:hypothetical protein
VFVEFLKRLLHHAAQPIFLILDGGRYHHSRLVKDYVCTLSGKLQLFFLPPYSPELNPDEQVWNYLKHHSVAKAGLRNGKELRKYVLGTSSFVAKAALDHPPVLSYARHPVCGGLTTSLCIPTPGLPPATYICVSVTDCNVVLALTDRTSWNFLDIPVEQPGVRIIRE